MISFSLTEEQQALQTLAREFVEREVKPIALERDRITDPAQCIPWDVVDKGIKAGFKTLTLAKKYGGAEIDSVTMAIMCEEIGAGDLGVATIFFQGWWKVVQAIQRMANEKQIQEYLIPWRDNPRGFTGIAATEPEGGGSDNILPCLEPKAGLKMAATRDGEYVVLNGMKHFLTLNPYVTLWLTFTRTDKTKPVNQGLTIFLVPANTPGVSVGNVHDKMGVRLCPNAELIFDNVRVPITAQLGGWDTGLLELARDVLPTSNACTAAAILGVARAAMEMALDYAATRIQGGVPIIQHQAVQLKFADMWVNIETARLLIWRAMSVFDEVFKSGIKEGFDAKVYKSPKLYASEAAMKTVLEARMILGGLGIMRDVGMEKLFRDISTYQHADGTNDVLRLGLAHAGLGV